MTGRPSLPRPPGPGQRGFTVIEMMVAMTIGLLFLSSVIGVFYQSVDMADALEGQITLNREAREMFYLMREGGVAGGTAMVGMKGMTNATSGTTLQYNSGRLRLEVGGSILESRTLPTQTVSCTGTDEPVVGCVASGTVNTNGLLAKTPTEVQIDYNKNVVSPSPRWTEATLELLNPGLLGDRLSVSGAESASFHFLFHHTKEASEP